MTHRPSGSINSFEPWHKVKIRWFWPSNVGPSFYSLVLARAIRTFPKRHRNPLVRLPNSPTSARWSSGGWVNFIFETLAVVISQIKENGVRASTNSIVQHTCYKQRRGLEVMHRMSPQTSRFQQMQPLQAMNGASFLTRDQG